MASSTHTHDEYVSKDGTDAYPVRRGVLRDPEARRDGHIPLDQRAASAALSRRVRFRWNNRSALGVEDFERADNMLKGAKGKRLTYRPTDERTEPGEADA